MRRIAAVARKEFIHIRRDPRALVSVLFMPVFLIFLFTYAISLNVENIPAAVLDEDLSAHSRDYVGVLHTSDFFRIQRQLSSLDQVDEVFDRGEVRAVIIIEPGFGRDLSAGRTGRVAVLLDGSEPNAAEVGRVYAESLSRAFSGRLARAYVKSRGLVAETSRPVVEPRPRLWYNPSGKSADFLVPGLLVILIMSVSVQQTTNALVLEKELGTLEQLIASPIRRIELMLGKVLPWAILAALDVVVITTVALVAFRIPLRGDLGVYALGSVLFVLGNLGMGLIISTRASSTEVANQVALLASFLPGFMLSGFVFPIRNMPLVLRLTTYLFPARYYMAITRSVFLKGSGLQALWPQLVGLAVYAALTLVVSSTLYRKKM